MDEKLKKFLIDGMKFFVVGWTKGKLGMIYIEMSKTKRAWSCFINCLSFK